MLVFDIADKLKVVGTWHALNKHDKALLENLIEASDFVACEGEKDIDIIASPFVKGLRYDEMLKTYLCGEFNSLYIEAFSRWVRKRIKEVNRSVRKKTGIKRDGSFCEFKFCEEVAAAKGKEYYVVDLTSYDIITNMLKQKTSDKIKQILGIRENNFEKLLNEFDSRRENYMLARIEQHEGQPINNLQRQGILVVGCGHAVNYLEMHRNLGLGQESRS